MQSTISTPQQTTVYYRYRQTQGVRREPASLGTYDSLAPSGIDDQLRGERSQYRPVGAAPLRESREIVIRTKQMRSSGSKHWRMDASTGGSGGGDNGSDGL